MSGIFTAMLPWRRATPTPPRLAAELSLTPEMQAVADAYDPITALADYLGWPDDWVVCPSCSAHSWRMPPHIFDPCPMLVEMAQSAGLKMDAERSAAIRTGVTLEAQAQALQRLFEQAFGDSEDDE